MVAADFMLFVRRVHGRITEEKFTCSRLKPVKRRERERLRERELFIERSTGVQRREKMFCTTKKEFLLLVTTANNK